MMNYRSSSDYEQNVSWVEQQPSSKDPASLKRKMISNTSNSSDLYSRPTALIISPSGERKTCALDSLDKTSNPFLDSLSDEFKQDGNENYVPKLSSKHEQIRQKNRKKVHTNHRRMSKIILNQRLSTRKHPKCVAVQTDESLNLISLPECIGDGRGSSQSFMDLTSSTTIEAFNLYNRKNKQYISENQRKCLSFVLMVVLIFWITSIILGVEIPGEFCRIVLNYFWSLPSIFYYQEKQLSFLEKCWRYLLE